MQKNANSRLMTTAEAADYLRIKERKLYELVAEQAIPCTKVTGKWLFPRADLDRWLLSGLTRPVGTVPAEPTPIIGGSHDPLLQWVLSECRAGLAMLPEGSESGYQRLLKGEVLAAAIHLHDPVDPAADANVDRVSGEPTLYDAVLLGFAIREQGLLVARGNPLGLATSQDVVARQARVAVRPESAGAQQLLKALLARDGASPQRLKIALVAPTGPDIAQAVRAGHADCGLASRSVANTAGLDFVPLITERFDILVRQRDSYRPRFQAFLELLRRPIFQTRARELGGLDVSGAGAVRWAP